MLLFVSSNLIKTHSFEGFNENFQYVFNKYKFIVYLSNTEHENLLYQFIIKAHFAP